MIENRDNYTYLGVQIDSFLNFDYMTDHVCNKLRIRVAMIHRISQFVPKSTLFNLYFAFVQPLIDYCLLIWGHTSKSNISRIQSFQNRIARVISNIFSFNISGISIVKDLGWFNVTERRDFLTCMLIYKCLLGDAPNYLSDQLTYVDELSVRETRQTNCNLLHVPFYKTCFYERSFLLMVLDAGTICLQM